MLDLELPDPRLVGVGRLQFRDHAAAFVAQTQGFVERRERARANEPAVALEKRQLVRQRRVEIALEPGAIGSEPRIGAQEFERELLRGLENAGQRRRGGEAVANGGEVARAAAVEAQAGESPQKVGRMHERPAQGVAHRRGLDQELKRVEPPIDSLRVSQRIGEPLGEQASPCGGHSQVDCRQKRTIARPAQGPSELEVRAGRGIDFEARPPRAPRWSRERRPRLELGALDIGERERGGGDLGASERAEAVKGFDAVKLADPPFGRRSRRRRRARAASRERASHGQSGKTLVLRTRPAKRRPRSAQAARSPRRGPLRQPPRG